LRSVQAQTYQNWEAIVADDGSRDSTPEVVEQLAREDGRIRLVRQDRNRGAQAARNAGIHAAKGEWIAFLDSDDQYLPHSLEVRLKFVTKEGAEVIHSDCYIIDVDGSRRLYDRRPIAGYAYTRLLKGEGPMFQGLLVSKKALAQINYLDENIVAFQEWETSIRLAKHYPLAYVPEPTFSWDCRNSDTISKDLRRNGRGYEQVVRKHSLAIVRHAGPRMLAEHYRRIADWYRRGGDHQAEQRCVLMARAWSCLDPMAVLRKLWHLLRLRRV
jgi:glycosyltransferase involved in cell wall biosynthesis